jgi:cardiolipin synthase
MIRWPLLAVVCISFACGRDPQVERFRLHGDVPPPGDGFSAALSQHLGVTVHAGNRVGFINDDRLFDALAEDIREARSSIHILSYIWKNGQASDRILAALIPRARAGVECRIIVDAFGSMTFEEDGVGPALRAAGCDVREFRPPAISDIARNHRKIVVIDGRIGVTGGFGIRDDWLLAQDGDPRWRDTNVRIAGPVVADMQRAFAENWLECGAPLLPASVFPAIEADGPVRAAFVASTASPYATRAERLMQLVIASARKQLWIENAYFVPSEPISDQLERKAKSGVDVRLIAPGKKSDSTPSFILQRNEYGELIESGVRVFEYQPTMMHAKTVLVDGLLAVVGSVNLEPLSLNSLEEGALVMEGAEVARDLEAQFLADAKRSKELGRD